MNQKIVLVVRSLAFATGVVWAVAAPASVAVQGSVEAGHEAELARAGQEDLTPQARYESAIREAGGGLKLNLAECRAQPVALQKSCERQARALYETDMERARALRNNPELRPINETGGPIREVESITITRP